MKFVALISGGKDSIFNIIHCLSNSHELIALANLRPSNLKTQELDSFMFQTVGHDVVDYYTEMIPDVPLYRGNIVGVSRNQSMDYKPTDSDEIEDLYEFLAEIKQKHPDLEAVSVGAILSSYQRTRVENVCSRLGLTSLAYLWQRDQGELMAEMVRSPMEAIFIKVAAVGLNEKHLGLTLKQGYSKLLALNERFDLHICGEGGEFETLVIDAPFFKKRLRVVESVIEVGNDDVCYLYPKVVLEEKKQWFDLKDKEIHWIDFIGKKKGLLDEKFLSIYKDIGACDAKLTSEDDKDSTQLNYASSTTVKKVNNKLYISNIQSSDKLTTIEEQTNSIFSQLTDHLQANNLEFSSIQHSTLLLSSMSNFATVNKIYSTHFNISPIPPSRVCVETNLPSKKLIQLSVIAISNANRHKSGLHVQGRSYWAPANIGPYSQAVISGVDSVASLSGQIPLVPSSMELSSQDSCFNSVLSLQHLDNVKGLTQCVNQLTITSFVKSDTTVPIVVNTWENYCQSSEIEGVNNKDCFLIVQVKELPRGADVEWGGFSFKKIVDMYADDSDEEQEDSLCKKLSDMQLTKNISLEMANEGTFFLTLGLTKEEFASFNFHTNYHYTVYTKGMTIFVPDDVSVDFIPVVKVWNFNGQCVDFGVVVTGNINNSA